MNYVMLCDNMIHNSLKSLINLEKFYQTQQDIDIINKIYLRSPTSIPKFPHLIYTNKTIQ